MHRRTRLRSQKSPGRTWIAIIPKSGTHAEDSRTDRSIRAMACVTTRLGLRTVVGADDGVSQPELAGTSRRQTSPFLPRGSREVANISCS